MTRRRKWYRVSVRKLGRWHQLMGLIATVFVMLLVITGILLNHTQGLSLDRRYVQAEWLLDWYGIRLPDTPVSYRADGRWITQIGERLYLNNIEIAVANGRLIGAVALDEILVIAVEGQLLLFTQTGALVERLGGPQGVPAGMQRIGLNHRQQLVIKGAHGYYIADKSLLSWRETRSVMADWAESETLVPILHETLRRAYRGKGLSVERLLLDVHSGRILGPAGVIMIDAAAILLLLLAASGIWLWAKRKKD
jgi:hypothetical protein